MVYVYVNLWIFLSSDLSAKRLRFHGIYKFPRSQQKRWTHRVGNQRHLYRCVGRTICVVDVDEVEVWQYITSGLCNQSLISHLECPTTKIGPWYQWYCSLIGHHYADLSTWCNTLIRHGKTRKMCGRCQCTDRERTFSNKQVLIAWELCGL